MYGVCCMQHSDTNFIFASTTVFYTSCNIYFAKIFTLFFFLLLLLRYAVTSWHAKCFISEWLFLNTELHHNFGLHFLSFRLFANKKISFCFIFYFFFLHYFAKTCFTLRSVVACASTVVKFVKFHKSRHTRRSAYLLALFLLQLNQDSSICI